MFTKGGLRQRRRRRGGRSAVALLLAVSLLIGLRAVSTAAAQAAEAPGKASFRFPAGAREVRVPLRVSGNLAAVSARIGGKQADCLLDTGSGAISVPQELRSAVALDGRNYQVRDAGGTSSIHASGALRLLEIGGYERSDAHAVVLGDKNARADQQSETDAIPLLGNSAFTPVVVTIDYRLRELCIRPPSNSFSYERMKEGSHVLDFQLDRGTEGVPIIPVLLNGRAAKVILDTGWGGSTIGISRALREAAGLSPGEIVVHSFLFSSARVEKAHGALLSWDASSEFQFKTDALVLPSQFPLGEHGADGIIGMNILKHYRLTIDYPRRKILLEPHGGETTITISGGGRATRTIRVTATGTIDIEPGGSVTVKPD
jgi:predicted aspartyl protease